MVNQALKTARHLPEFYACGFFPKKSNIFVKTQAELLQPNKCTTAPPFQKKGKDFLRSSNNDLKPQFWFGEKLPLIPHKLPFTIAKRHEYFQDSWKS